jgi:alpha-ribazole phosphatase
MKRIIFVRHGETDQAGAFCGQSDPDLNAAGEDQAQTLARELRGADLNAVYSSDLRRAWRTAQAIAAAAGVAHSVSRDLREIAFGAWEGLRWKEIEERYPQEATLWAAEYPNRAAPGGEDFQDFSERVLKQIHRIRERSSGPVAGPVCIVSHGGVIRLALTRLFGMPEEEAWAYTKGYGRIIDLIVDPSVEDGVLR